MQRHILFECSMTKTFFDIVDRVGTGWGAGIPLYCRVYIICEMHVVSPIIFEGCCRTYDAQFYMPPTDHNISTPRGWYVFERPDYFKTLTLTGDCTSPTSITLAHTGESVSSHPCDMLAQPLSVVNFNFSRDRFAVCFYWCPWVQLAACANCNGAGEIKRTLSLLLGSHVCPTCLGQVPCSRRSLFCAFPFLLSGKTAVLNAHEQLKGW